MKLKAALFRAIVGSVLVISLAACQEKPGNETEDSPPQDTGPFFTHAESDHISRAAPLPFDLFVGSSAADIDSLAGFPVIMLTEEGLQARYPEQVTGYGDIGPFWLSELLYDPTRHIATAVYSSCEWHPLAGSIVCYHQDSPRVFEQNWLTEIDYLCDRCVQIFIMQGNLLDEATQVSAHQIGASATIQSIPIGNRMGEFVVGHWMEAEATSSVNTQTLQWVEDGKYGTLRWQACNWQFEIRAKGQDGGFVFEDLSLIAQDIHNQVECQE